MARIRSIKPEIWSHEQLGQLSMAARLTFMGLISLADDKGRGQANSERLWGWLHAGQSKIEKKRWAGVLQELADVRDDHGPLVVFYEVAGARYYWLPGFCDQQYIEKPKESKLPAPPNSGNDPLPAGDAMPLEGIRDQGSGKGRDICAEPSRTKDSAPATVPDELKPLPLYASDPKLCGNWESLLKGWKTAYPRVDVLAEVRKAHAWEMSNPSLRKRNRSRFLNTWLGRAQDQPLKPGEIRPFRPAAPPPSPPRPCARCNTTGFVSGPLVGGASTVLPCPECQVKHGG